MEKNDRLVLYAKRLKSSPMDIHAFKMRELEADFGTSISPIEIVSSTTLINEFNEGWIE